MQERRSAKRVWLGRLWKLFCFPVVGVLLWTVSGEGMRRELPLLATRLCDIGLPRLGFLSRWDLASVLSLTLLISTCTSLIFAFRCLFLEQEGQTGERNFVFKCVINVSLAVGLVGLDCFLMALGLAHHFQDTGGGLFDDPRPVINRSCIVAATAYGLILVFIAWVAVQLEQPDS